MGFKRITVCPDQMCDVPFVPELSIPVTTIFSMVAEFMREDEILKVFPDLERKDIQEILMSASETSLFRVSPCVDEERQKIFKEALIYINQKFGRVLKRLAD